MHRHSRLSGECAFEKRDANNGSRLRGCELIAAARSEVSRKIKLMPQARILGLKDGKMAAVVEAATENVGKNWLAAGGSLGCATRKRRAAGWAYSSLKETGTKAEGSKIGRGGGRGLKGQVPF